MILLERITRQFNTHYLSFLLASGVNAVLPKLAIAEDIAAPADPATAASQENQSTSPSPAPIETPIPPPSSSNNGDSRTSEQGNQTQTQPGSTSSSSSSKVPKGPSELTEEAAKRLSAVSHLQLKMLLYIHLPLSRL